MARGQITIRGGGHSVTAWLGPEGGRVTAGYGGWEVVARPRRLGITQWNGRSPVQQVISITLDGFRMDKSIESDCRKIEQMAGIDLPAYTEPPVIKVDGPIPHSDAEWVIEALEWGPADRRNDGDRIRQDITITILRYVATDRLQLVPAAEKARQKVRPKGPATSGRNPRKPRVYIVKAGDTLSAIAARLLGKADRWREIAKLNNIRDPRRLVIGQKLKLP